MKTALQFSVGRNRKREVFSPHPLSQERIEAICLYSLFFKDEYHRKNNCQQYAVSDAVQSKHLSRLVLLDYWRCGLLGKYACFQFSKGAGTCLRYLSTGRGGIKYRLFQLSSSHTDPPARLPTSHHHTLRCPLQDSTVRLRLEPCRLLVLLLFGNHRSYSCSAT